MENPLFGPLRDDRASANCTSGCHKKVTRLDRETREFAVLVIGDEVFTGVEVPIDHRPLVINFDVSSLHL